MSTLKERLDGIKERISTAAKKSGRSEKDITLVAVTKTYEADVINEAIDLGITDIGENKVQEILRKYDSVKPVRWHLIGHLQSNKVKYIIDKVSMIHSVDSIHLIDEIERQAQKKNIIMDILIQVNISGEESKFGIKPEEIYEILEYADKLKHVKVRGLMTILPKDDNIMTLKLHFVNIRRLSLDISEKKYDNIHMDYLSMGMSGDFEEAIMEGSNMVRIGSAIFGERKYV